MVRQLDFKSFASGITARLKLARCDPLAEWGVAGLHPETEAGFVEFAAFALLHDVDFSALNPKSAAGKFLTAVKKKMVKDGAEGVFKRLGQARPERVTPPHSAKRLF